MSKAYDRIKEGLSEALSIAKGEQPAASITLDGHTYVQKAELDEAIWAGSAEIDKRREAESELAGCKIALEQAWESNRERQAQLRNLIGAARKYMEVTKEYFGDTEFDSNGVLASADAELFVLLYALEKERSND